MTDFLNRRCEKITSTYLFGSFIAAQSFGDIDLGVVAQNDLEHPLNFELDLETRLKDFKVLLNSVASFLDW
ncbi:MAG: hypothetical protein JSW39_18005 [Desulfobacterales bacterium]|nr:MAG: hypothetical protein JSW39_18005 [Desulfobacterales bacterium]